MENITASIPKILTTAEKLTTTTVELYQLKMIKVGSLFFADFISKLIITSLFFLLLLFASIGTAFYFNNYFNNNFTGFFLVSGAYFVLAFFLLLFRKSIINKPIQNSVIRRILKRDL